VSTPILTKAQLDAKRVQEIRDAAIADSRSKSKRWAERRRKIKARKHKNHHKVRKHLEKQGRRNAR
jgi:hypothetical protein